MSENNFSVTKLKYCPQTWTTGLGFAIALQLVGLLPEEERSLLEYPLEGHWKPEYWARFIKGGFVPDKDGRIKIPEGPGLGIEIDWEVIRKFGKRIYHRTPGTIAYKTLVDRGFRQTMYLKKKKAEQLARSADATFSIPEAPFQIK
ncbi:hypothetical protein JW960_24650 [candidate division KSB1 bacterium]|nr:hypothetical protein [candidate division KSB1 bacterium]